MAITVTEKNANISPLKMGEPIKQVEVVADGAETATLTFDQQFAATPKVLSIGDASISVTGISTTAVAISTTGAVVETGVVLVQGKVGE